MRNLFGQYTSVQTCRYSVPELSRFFILTCGYQYVLLGNIHQSDCIEGRFGWIRQLSGANYYISVRQLLESYYKIKTISLLKFSKIGIKEIIETVHLKESDAETKIAKTAYEIYKSLSLIEDINRLVVYKKLFCITLLSGIRTLL